MLLISSGCKRAFYREQADADAYFLIEDKASGTQLTLDDFSINPNPASRFYDPFDPDRPPMPPDDSEAHALMHRVAGMKGDKRWHCDGDTVFVENPDWAAHLPLDEQGRLVIDRQAAVQVGLLHSRDYQRELEDLYLSALDVSFERFRFETQFSLTNNTFLTADARNRNGTGQSSTVLQSDTSFGASRLFATGGELVVGLANSMVWQFSGTDSNFSTTLLDFNLVQPLLRGAGRARVLERLTISERALLANVRQMERYRRGYYLNLVTGRDGGPGPTRRGGVFGSGLQGFTGVGAGGFGRVGNVGNTGGVAGGFTGGAGAQQAGGFMGLLQQQLQIRNQEANVAALRDSLQQLDAAYAAGRIDRFQADLAQQALYSARSRLLTSNAQYESTLDNFKVLLGLPPQLEMQITDRMLAPFELIDPAIPPLQNALSNLQDEAGEAIVTLLPMAQNAAPAEQQALRAGLEQLRKSLRSAREVQRRTAAHFAAVQLDLNRFESALPERRAALQRLLAISAESAEGEGNEAELRSGDVETIRSYQTNLEELPAKLHTDLRSLAKIIRTVPERLEALENELAGLQTSSDDATVRVGLRRLLGRVPDELRELSDRVLELSLIQARAKAEAVTLQPVDLKPDEAFEIARLYRRDWMNARTALVDSWRLIAFNANDLESQLDLVFSGDISNQGDNPLNLNSSTGRLRVGFQFDAPLNRVAERNAYREALVTYQQSKRDYYLFVDRISQSLRNTLRTVGLDQLNFELRRAAIAVAIDQVQLARLRLQQPPKPGEVSVFGATLARDLVQALGDLLQVQNDFLSVWVNYEVERLQLDFDLETMQLDEHGLWIDPGSPGQGAWPGAEFDPDDDPRCWRPTPEIVPALPPAPTQQPRKQPANKAAAQPTNRQLEQLPPGEPRGERPRINDSDQPAMDNRDRVDGDQGLPIPAEAPSPSDRPFLPDEQGEPAMDGAVIEGPGLLPTSHHRATRIDRAVRPAGHASANQNITEPRIAATPPERTQNSWKAVKLPRRDP